MYSYDDRLRAVRHYIELGKRAGLIIRQLGYPTKNALKAWHRAYEERQDLPAAYRHEPRFTSAQRQSWLWTTLSPTDAAWRSRSRRAGLPVQVALLAGWIRDAHPQLRPRVGQAHEAQSSQAKQSAVMARCACAREVPRRWLRSWVCPGAFAVQLAQSAAQQRGVGIDEAPAEPFAKLGAG